jgi:O-antigen/teichoic acid export membrane protein
VKRLTAALRRPCSVAIRARRLWPRRGAAMRGRRAAAFKYCAEASSVPAPGLAAGDLMAGTAGAVSKNGGLLAARIERGGVVAFAIYLGGAGLTYGAQLAVARTIGAHGYGLYAYVLAWMTVLAYASALGFDISLLRFVPAYQTQEAWALLQGVIRYSGRRVMAAGCGIAMMGIAVTLARLGELQPDLAATFLVGFALIPVLALLRIRSSVVRAFGGVISAIAPDRIVRDGTLLVLIGVASLGAWSTIDAPWAMGATLLGSAAALGLVTLAMRRLVPRTFDSLAPAYDASTWRRTALPLLVIGAAEVLMNRTGIMMLGWMSNAQDAGIYALAFNIAFATVLPRTAVNALLAPAISELFVRNDQAALRALVAKGASWTLLGAAAIAVPVAILAKPLLALFGHDFAAGVPALRILLVGQIVAAAAGSQQYLMTMTGYERRAAMQLVFSVIANAAGAAALIGPLGPTGVAIAATTALICWNIVMALWIGRHMRLSPGVFADFPWPIRLDTLIARRRAGPAE